MKLTLCEFPKLMKQYNDFGGSFLVSRYRFHRFSMSFMEFVFALFIFYVAMCHDTLFTYMKITPETIFILY